jgi:hypothetical protein
MILSSKYRALAERFLQRFRIMIMEEQTLGMILAEGLGLGAGMARPLSAFDQVKMLLHEWGYIRESSLLLQLTYYVNISTAVVCSNRINEPYRYPYLINSIAG